MGNSSTSEPNRGPSVQISDFEVEKLIGVGGFGKVWRVKYKQTGQIYACKVLSKDSLIKQDLVEHTRLERDIMGQFIGHPFIVSLHFAFQTENKLYFVLDYLPGGSLWFHLREAVGRGEPFSEDEVRFYAAEILLALAALHSVNIVYRDLKLENILLDESGHLVLTDFGLSARLASAKKRIVSYSGSPAYIAPEILTDTEGHGHGKTVDLWSFGVLLHILLTGGEAPFWSDDVRELFDQIKSAPIDLHRYASRLSPMALNLLRGLLERDSEKRLGCGGEGIAELFDHPWFEGIDWDRTLAREVPPPRSALIEAEIRESEDLGSSASASITREQVQAAADMPSKPKGSSSSKKDKFRRFTFSPARADPSSAASSSLFDADQATASPGRARIRQWRMDDIKVQSSASKQKAVETLSAHLKKSRRSAMRIDSDKSR